MEGALSILLILAMLLCVISWCYPWKALSTRRGRIALQLPWAATLMYVLYELLSRQQDVAIRVDLLFWPVLAGLGLATLLLYGLRMIWIIRQRA